MGPGFFSAVEQASRVAWRLCDSYLGMVLKLRASDLRKVCLAAKVPRRRTVQQSADVGWCSFLRIES